MDITPFLKYYLGCKAQVKRKTVMDEYLTGTIVEITKGSNHGDWVDVDFGTVVEIYTRTWEKSMSNFHSFFLREDEIKPILRHLSSITDKEMISLLMATVPDGFEDKPDSDEYSIDEAFHNDGGNMVDGYVAIGANYTCRCYVGQITITHDGTIHLFDEDGDREKATNLPRAYHYLHSIGIWLYGQDAFTDNSIIDADTNA